MHSLCRILAIAIAFAALLPQLSAQTSRNSELPSQGKSMMPDSVAAAPSEAKPARFPQLTMEQLNEQQKALAREMLQVSSAGLGGPYSVLLRSPEMSAARFRLTSYLRFHTTVPRPLNEFAILIQARLSTAQYEWWAHYPLALKAGLPQTVADQLKQGKRPSPMSAEQAAVYQFCVEMSLNHGVSDPTFDALRKIFNDQQIVDLIAISGEYVSTSMLLNVAEVGIPNGGAPPLKPLTDAKLRKGMLTAK
jgi:4-carboxymuconolactone decarboxylase